LALLAGIAASGNTALGQVPRDEPVVWQRQGTARTSPSELEPPRKLPPLTAVAPAASPEPRPAVVPAAYAESRRAEPLRPVWNPFGTNGTARFSGPVRPANYDQRPVTAGPVPTAVPPGFPPPGARPQLAAIPVGIPPAAAVPCEPPKPAPAPTWHGNTYPVQPLAPPGAFQVAPTGPGYYTLLDSLRGEEREKPPRWPYPRAGAIQPPFNELNFSYLDPIPFEDRDWAERLKRVPLGEHWLFSTGGEARYRYNHETNSRLTGRDNTYSLIRGRAYTDVWYEDRLRLYTEFLYGDTSHQDLPPLSRDVNRGDIQQLFVDVKAAEVDGNPVFVRAGRQEMFYGSQRLVSTVDWGNNRPRFDGVKVFYRSEKFDGDLFVTRPTQVRFAQLDPWDRNQTFSGAWLTYKPKKGTFVDAYYLNLENDNPGVARGQFRTGSFNVSTFGTRYFGKRDSGLLLDAELMLQTGHWADQSILAHAYSAYAGWYFKDAWATPTIWAGYDYASGDPDPNRTGRHQTFNQLFGFGHYYFGFADLVARQNIHDFTVQGYLYPSNWITGGLQYHVFRLDSSKDALYNAAGGMLRRSPTGVAGFEVGSEIDALANFHLTDRQDVFVSYSHFFPGSFVQRTGSARQVDYLYAQYSWRW
jgi:hypothetical protein